MYWWRNYYVHSKRRALVLRRPTRGRTIRGEGVVFRVRPTFLGAVRCRPPLKKLGESSSSDYYQLLLLLPLLLLLLTSTTTSTTTATIAAIEYARA